MTERTVTLLLEPITPDALTEGELDDLTSALARQLDAPELTASVALLHPEGEPIGKGAKGLGQALGQLLLEVLPDTLPALVDFLKGWVTRERRVRIKLQRGGDLIELDYDARTMEEARLMALIERLRDELQGRP